MPAYEYLCQQCGGHFERRQKMSDPQIETCPDCGGGVRRLISGGAGAITKGAGSAAGGAGSAAGGAGSAAGPSMCTMGGPCCGGETGCGSGRECLN